MIEVTPYQVEWYEQFEQLKSAFEPILFGLDVAIEHVGSTSVVGLAAKPIIDIDLIVKNLGDIPLVIKRMRSLGYEHVGDLGITGREVLRRDEDLFGIPLHLYVGWELSPSIRNHLILKSHLKNHPDDRVTYGALKMQLAKTVVGIDEYIERKSEFILSILGQYDFLDEALKSIEAENRRK